MGITERHRRRRMPQEVADGGQGNPPHHEPRGEGMAEVVKVEVRQASAVTGCLKGMPYVIPPMPRCIVKDPRYVLSRS